MISAIPPCVLQMLALFTVLFKGKNNGLLARATPESRADFNQNSLSPQAQIIHRQYPLPSPSPVLILPGLTMRLVT